MNASDESDAGDDASSAAAIPSTDTATAAAPVATGDATSSAPPTDSTEAAALALLAGSPKAYSTAAAVTGASAVAGASLTGASLTDGSLTDGSEKVSAVSAAAVSAAVTADAAQAMLLQGDARADKHASGAIDAATASGGADAAAGMSQLGPSSGTAPVDAPPTPTLRVAANLDSADFPQDLAARVSWMVDNNVNGAKLQVNPPQLGPIELRILVTGDHAQVWMSAHSAVTRDALESSSPTLREMLGTQGFSQVSVDISQRSFQERPAYSPPYEQTSTAGRSGAAAAATVAANSTARSSLGAVDAYA